jgi:hypothetical protein
MRIAVLHHHFLVIDELVEAPQFKLLYQSLRRAKYRTHAGWASVWSLAEQGGYRCSPFTGDSIVRDGGNPASVAYAIFAQALDGILPELEYLTGRRGEDWTHFNGNAVMFPPGGALNWHTDKKYAASYSYYCQSEWQRRWGGELLVQEQEAPSWGRGAPEGTGAARAAGAKPEGEAVDDIGYYVAPIANRLVVVRGAIPHRIAAVSPAAGENYRMSITGFFVAGEAGEDDEA